MGKKFVCLIAIAFCGFLSAPFAAAQGTSFEGDLLERWRSKSPAERELLKARFERFNQLSPESQQALRERLSGMRERLGDLESSLDQNDRRILDGLPETKRKEVLGKLLRARMRFRGQSLRGGLSEQVRRELDQAEPGQRPLLLERHRRHLHERFQERGSQPRRMGGAHRRPGEGRGLPGGLDEQQREQLRNRVFDGLRMRMRGAGERLDQASPIDDALARLTPEQAKQLLEAGRPRLEEFLDGRPGHMAERLERISEAAQRSGAFEAPELELLRQVPVHEILMRLRRTAELGGATPLGG